MKTTTQTMAAIFAMHGAQIAIEVNAQQGFGRVLGGGAEWVRVVAQALGR